MVSPRPWDGHQDAQLARHFLPKPFDVEELARSVADAVASTDASESITAAVPAGTTGSRMACAASDAWSRGELRLVADGGTQRTPSPAELSSRD